MAIPNNILREHIERAIAEIKTSQIPSPRMSVNYLLIANGIELPPKYVISIANKFVNGVELESKLFRVCL